MFNSPLLFAERGYTMVPVQKGLVQGEGTVLTGRLQQPDLGKNLKLL